MVNLPIKSILLIVIVIILILLTFQSISSLLFIQLQGQKASFSKDFILSAHVILMEHRASQGMFVPGSDHWFHFLEHIVINLNHTQSHIWPHGSPHKKLFIIFQEKESAVKLSSFCALMLTAVMSGGHYPTIHIGYTAEVKSLYEQIKASSLTSPPSTSVHHDNTLSIDFYETHIIQISPITGYTYHAKSKRATNLESISFYQNQSYAGYYHLLHTTYSDTYEWFLNEQRHMVYYQPFRQAIDRICSLHHTLDTSYVKEGMSETDGYGYDGDDEDRYEYYYRRVKYSDIPIHPLSSMTPPSTNIHIKNTSSYHSSTQSLSSSSSSSSSSTQSLSSSSLSSSSSSSHRTVLIYQRDSSRRLLNAGYVRNILDYHLNTLPVSDSFEDNRQSNSPIMLSSKDGNNYLRSLDVANSTVSSIITTNTSISLKSRRWNVTILTHSNSRPACELLQVINNATIFLTPHGFQSMLLLFQPMHSLLAEVHPYHYIQPSFYGEMQTSIRNHMNFTRPYLYEESIMDIHTHFGLIYWFNTLLDTTLCHSQSSYRSVCRYIYRLQSVYMSDNFIHKILNVTQKYFT